MAIQLARPVGARIGHGHIQAGCDASLLGAAEDIDQLNAVILKHPAHQRWVAEVEQPRLPEQVIPYIVGDKRIVSAGTVQEITVDAGRTDDDRIRRAELWVDDHAVGKA